MTLEEVKKVLSSQTEIGFQLPEGQLVESHFHVTEVGLVSKSFIDCGGTLRKSQHISFQLWSADDYDHRLHPDKLLKIIELSEKALDLDASLAVEVEYQGRSIESYDLDFQAPYFLLKSKATDCLAKDKCGIPSEKPKVKLSELQTVQSCCKPGSGCC